MKIENRSCQVAWLTKLVTNISASPIISNIVAPQNYAATPTCNGHNYVRALYCSMSIRSESSFMPTCY